MQQHQQEGRPERGKEDGGVRGQERTNHQPQWIQQVESGAGGQDLLKIILDGLQVVESGGIQGGHGFPAPDNHDACQGEHQRKDRQTPLPGADATIQQLREGEGGPEQMKV